jgi:hypothetical protein
MIEENAILLISKTSKSQETTMINDFDLFYGCVTSMKWIKTRTGVPMVVFAVGNRSCKAFKEVAEGMWICGRGNALLEFLAIEGRYQGKPQYTVIQYDFANKHVWTNTAQVIY